MNKPNISWYISEENDYIQDNEYYLGSFSQESEIKMNVQVWNNRYVKTHVDSIQNARLAIYFDSIEDNTLLQYCSVSVEDKHFPEIPVIFNKGVIDIGLLSGDSNNGLDSVDNHYNFKNITIIFKNLPNNLKNGLKNMFLDIEIN